jgi:hypothetical protein
MLVVHCILKMRCTTVLPELQRIFLNAMQFYHHDFEQLPTNNYVPNYRGTS